MLLKWLNVILIILFIAFAAMFAVANQEVVVVTLPGALAGTASSPLYALVFAALSTGFFCGALVAWISGLRYRRQATRLARQNRELEKELNNLRNLPLDNDLL